MSHPAKQMENGLPAKKAGLYQNLSAGLLIALIFACLAWELWLAPLRPGGSWWALKALPLLAPLFGVLHGRPRSYQWLALLVWFYVLEGLTRAFSEHGAGQWLATAQTALGITLFLSLSGFIRSRPG